MKIIRTILSGPLVVMLVSFSFLGCGHYVVIEDGTTKSTSENYPFRYSVTSIVDGKTSRFDILVLLGEPQHRYGNDDTFIYSWAESTKHSYSKYKLIIGFDEKGIVKEHALSKKHVDKIAD